MEEKNLQLERTVFFCDAVIAIAITLLVFNLKLEHISGDHLSFGDIIQPWKNFLAFTLSFINIANFWKTHHSFFAHVKKVDEALLWYNILWLFFIVTLPFSTTILSAHFFDTPAIFLYCLNTLFITIMQNTIWDYASLKKDFINEKSIDQQTIRHFRFFCNLDMINAGVALIISLTHHPILAFICLFTKLPLFIIARLFFFRGRYRRSHSSK